MVGRKINKKDLIYRFFKIAPHILKYLKKAFNFEKMPKWDKRRNFYSKVKTEFSSSWIKTFTRYSESIKKNIYYVVCNDLPTLIWLANLTDAEFNPTLSKIDKFDFQTRLF